MTKKKLGDCYENSVKFFLKAKDKDLVLVQGLVTGTGGMVGGKKFGHSWLEDEHTVTDVSKNFTLIIPKLVYYSLGQIQENEIKRYTYSEMMGMLEKYNVYGPWEFKPTDFEIQLAKKRYE